jgi:acetyl-CoA carboxylase carboxyl transferase subunit beta
MLFTKDYEDNQSVCPRCDHHGRIGADARLSQMIDPASVLPAPKVKEDPLKFRDTKKYTDRLKAARAANPHPDALTNALGPSTAIALLSACRTSSFMGGSMGMAVGNAFVAGTERAIAEVPLHHLHGRWRRAHAGRHPQLMQMPRPPWRSAASTPPACPISWC